MRRWRWAWLLCGVLACGEPADPVGQEDESLLAGPAAERAMVRALLDEIAAAHRPEAITDEQIRALWESRVAGQPLPLRRPIEDVEDQLREELVQRARLTALIELVAELERSQGVERDLAAIEGLATLPIQFEEGP